MDAPYATAEHMRKLVRRPKPMRLTSFHMQTRDAHNSMTP